MFESTFSSTSGLRVDFRVHSLVLFLTLTELYKVTKFASWLVDYSSAFGWEKNKKRVIFLQNDVMNQAIYTYFIIYFVKAIQQPLRLLRVIYGNLLNYFVLCSDSIVYISGQPFCWQKERYHLRLSLIYLDLLQKWSGSIKKNIPLKKEGRREKKSERSTQTESL